MWRHRRPAGAASFLDALAGTGRSAIVTSGVDRLARARIQVSGLTAPMWSSLRPMLSTAKPSPDPGMSLRHNASASTPALASLSRTHPPASLALSRGCATLAVTTTTAYADLSPTRTRTRWCPPWHTSARWSATTGADRQERPDDLSTCRPGYQGKTRLSCPPTRG